MYIFQYLRHVLKLLPFQGATAPTRDTQGAASLALGYELHWAFSPPLLNPKLESNIYRANSLVRNPYWLVAHASPPHAVRGIR